MSYELCRFALNIIMSDSHGQFLGDLRGKKNHSKCIGFCPLEDGSEDAVDVGGVFSCHHKNYYSKAML